MPFLIKIYPNCIIIEQFYDYYVIYVARVSHSQNKKRERHSRKQSVLDVISRKLIATRYEHSQTLKNDLCSWGSSSLLAIIHDLVHIPDNVKKSISSFGYLSRLFSQLYVLFDNLILHEGEVFSQLLRKLAGFGQSCGQIHHDGARTRLISGRLLWLVGWNTNCGRRLFGPHLSRRRWPLLHLLLIHWIQMVLIHSLPFRLLLEDLI